MKRQTIPPEQMQRLVANHELYLNYMSRAHQQYLQLNGHRKPKGASGHQRVSTTFVLRGDDFYAGHVWFPRLVERATDAFLHALRSGQSKANGRAQSDWHIDCCALVSLAPMPRLPLSGELQCTLEASVRQRGEVVNFDLSIGVGGERLVRVTEGVARRYPGSPTPRRSSGKHLSPIQLLKDESFQRHLSLMPDDLELWHAGRLDVLLGPTYADVAAHVRTPSVPMGPDGWQQVDIAFSPERPMQLTGVQITQDQASSNMIGRVLDQAFYLSLMGLTYAGTTLQRDGWRVEPLPGHTMTLEMIGDAAGAPGPGVSLVSHMHGTVMREEPLPVLIADVASDRDGTPWMQIGNFGVALVPDYPIFDAKINPQGLAGAPDDRALVVDGMRYDALAMLHCSWGLPSAGFGRQFQKFDTSGRVSRLPGPPYQFITRICDINAETADMRPGSALTVEYDIPASAWYFDENAGVMPYAVLMEAVLQPCGWLSVYLGIPMQTDEPLFVRNLDGTGTQYCDVTPSAGVLRTTVTLKNMSRANHTFLHTYEIESVIGDTTVYRGETTFGHFPEESLSHQVGLAPDHILPDIRMSMDDAVATFRAEPNQKLHLFDRIVQYDPSGGIAGKGRVIAEKSVTPDAWFFKAHFFQDPVQPGSLGIEAMLHVLKWVMTEKGLDESFTRPRFEAIRTNQPMTWKYRGHVVPTHRLIGIVVDLLEHGEDEAGAYVLADAMLVVDDVPIYRAYSIGMRMVETASQSDRRPLDLSLSSSARHAFWAKQTGVKEWIVFDIYEALYQRFVGQIHVVDPLGLKNLKKRPAFYLANHQTAVESPIFNYIFSAVQTINLVGLAKDEHRLSWIGKLMDRAAQYPGVRLMQPMKFIERKNHMSALDVIKDLGRSMQQEHFSTLIHVEGTRSTHAGRPVETVSSTIIDSAIELNIPLIPVRFTGGLPTTDEGVRFDFPYRFGKQDFWIGSPIPAANLAERSMVDRKSVVLDAINRLGPPAHVEKPSSAPETDFADQVNHWQTHFGVAPEWAVILQCLDEYAERSDQTTRFLDVLRGEKTLMQDAEQTWFSQLIDVMRGSGHAEHIG